MFNAVSCPDYQTRPSRRPRLPSLTKAVLPLTLAALATSGICQPQFFGLGDTTEGYFQLDRSSIRGHGTKSATVWIHITQAPQSEAMKHGANSMLVLFIADCPGRTIRPLAWKAANASGDIIAEGVHGKDKQRVPELGSMDERIFGVVCR